MSLACKNGCLYLYDLPSKLRSPKSKVSVDDSDEETFEELEQKDFDMQVCKLQLLKLSVLLKGAFTTGMPCTCHLFVVGDLSGPLKFSVRVDATDQPLTEEKTL